MYSSSYGIINIFDILFNMDLLKLIGVGIGSIFLGIIVGFMAHSVWSGIGICISLCLAYILKLLLDGYKDN